MPKGPIFRGPNLVQKTEEEARDACKWAKFFLLKSKRHRGRIPSFGGVLVNLSCSTNVSQFEGHNMEGGRGCCEVDGEGLLSEYLEYYSDNTNPFCVALPILLRYVVWYSVVVTFRIIMDTALLVCRELCCVIFGALVLRIMTQLIAKSIASARGTSRVLVEWRGSCHSLSLSNTF